jgi:hypothetical protein
VEHLPNTALRFRAKCATCGGKIFKTISRADWSKNHPLAVLLRSAPEEHSGVEVFSRATEPRSIAPPSTKELNAVIERVTARWKSNVTVTLVDGFTGLPAPIQKAARDQGGDGEDIRSVFHRDTIYLVRGNIGSIKEAEDVLFREASEQHNGVRSQPPECSHGIGR